VSNDSGTRDASRGLRPSRRTWLFRGALVGALLVLATGGVVAARALLAVPDVQDFLTRYPGTAPLPEGAPVGFPVWVSWQHFLSAFMIMLIIRTGFQLRAKKRPANFYTRKNTGLFRTKNPPVRIGLPLWFHLSLDVLWIANGVIYVVLLFVTGQWVRVVPTTWEVLPNAVSAGLQYIAFDWPVENGWINYNSLQLIAYFVTVFVASPLAIATGVRLSPGLALRLRPLDRVFPLTLARRIHVAVMVYFVAFIATHVTLVLATGALRNLNHMYAGRDDDSWVGFWVFLVSIAVMAAGWFAARSTVLKWLAGRSGTVR